MRFPIAPDLPVAPLLPTLQCSSCTTGDQQGNASHLRSSAAAAAGAPPSRIRTRALPCAHSRPPRRRLRRIIAPPALFPRYCFFLIEYRKCSECEDSFDYVPFVCFMDSFFFQAGSQAR